MNKTKSKTVLTIIPLILILAISATLVTSPLAIGQAARVYPYPYINAIPNPVQVNMPTLFHVGCVYPTRRPQLGWYDLTVEITKPDGTTEILGPVTTDTTGGTGIQYTPTMVGTYTVRTHFPEQTKEFSDNRSGPEGTIMEEAYSEPIELIVQEDPIPTYPGHPLPKEYWVRPIDGQIREWYTIAGHWLETREPTATGPTSILAQYNDYAPESAHILFRKPLTMGGLAGGEMGEHGFEQGDAYEGKFLEPVIIGGVLYYNRFNTQGRAVPIEKSQEVVAVDLHTGEELWVKPLLDPNGTRLSLDFGQVFYFDSFNYHGVFHYLWAVDGSSWHAYDTFTGE